LATSGGGGSNGCDTIAIIQATTSVPEGPLPATWGEIKRVYTDGN
jgi:hypothetical protein